MIHHNKVLNVGAKHPNIVALYFDDTKCPSKTADYTGRYNWTETGTVPYANQGQPIGNFAVGPFAGSTNYFSQLGTLLNDAMAASPNSWTVQMYLKIPAGLSNYICFIGMNCNGFYFFGKDNGTEQPRFHNGNVTAVNFNTIIADNTWHHLAFTWDGNLLKCYRDNVFIGQNGDAGEGTWGTSTGPSYCGVWINPSDFALNGYINQLIFMNSVETQFPTIP